MWIRKLIEKIKMLPEKEKPSLIKHYYKAFLFLASIWCIIYLNLTIILLASRNIHSIMSFIIGTLGGLTLAVLNCNLIEKDWLLKYSGEERVDRFYKAKFFFYLYAILLMGVVFIPFNKTESTGMLKYFLFPYYPLALVGSLFVFTYIWLRRFAKRERTPMGETGWSKGE